MLKKQHSLEAMMRKLRMNNLYEASVFSSATRLISVLPAIPARLFPSSLLLFLLLLSTNFGCAKPYQQFSKGYLKLRWNTRSYRSSVHSHASSKFAFSMLNCFARLHPEKGNAGQDRTILRAVWIHHSPVASLINIHPVWCLSPEPNTEKNYVAAQARQWVSSACWNCNSSVENKNPHGYNLADLVLPPPAHNLLWGHFNADSVCTCFHLTAIISCPADKLWHKRNEFFLHMAVWH